MKQKNEEYALQNVATNTFVIEHQLHGSNVSGQKMINLGAGCINK